MADHVRKQIRDALVALLDAASIVDTRVYSGRVFVIDPTDLPALSVHVDGEDIAVESIHAPAPLSRSCEIRIDCLARQSDTLDDTLDELAKLVEHAIAPDLLLGDVLNQAMTPAGIEVDRSGEGDAPIGRLTLRYTAAYGTMNNAVDVPL